MKIAPQDASTKLHHRITEIYNSAARHRTHIDPFFSPGKLDLKASQAVEQDCERTEIGMFSKCMRSAGDFLRWRRYEAYVAAGGS